MTTHAQRITGGSRMQDADLDKRLDDLGWGLLFMLTGVIWLIPDEQIPHGAWLAAIGVLLLGLNVIRYLNRIPVHRLTVLLGALALAAGVGNFVGVDLPLVAILLLVIGVSIIVRPTPKRRHNDVPPAHA